MQQNPIFLHCARHAVEKSLAASVLVAVLVGGCPQEVSAQSSELGSMATRLSESLTASGRKTVAVVDFTNLEGCVTELGRYMAEDLSVELASNAKSFEVIDRTNLKVIMQEHNLVDKGILDPATARKLGQIAGVDALVTGTIASLSDSVHVSAKVLDTKTAMVLGGITVDMPRTRNIEDLLAKGVLNCDQPGSASIDSSTTGNTQESSPSRNTQEVRGRVGIFLGRDTETDNPGAKVTTVEPNGPAAKAGLQPGDLIVSVDGQGIKDRNDFRNIVSPREPGTTVQLTYLRNGIRSTVTVGIVAPLDTGQISANRSTQITIGDFSIKILRCGFDRDRINCYGTAVNQSSSPEQFAIDALKTYMIDDLGDQSTETNGYIGVGVKVGANVRWGYMNQLFGQVLQPGLPVSFELYGLRMKDGAKSVSIVLVTGEGQTIVRDIALYGQ